MQSILNWLEVLAQQIPVYWFVLIGSLLEEVIAPIPSPLVMMLAGSIASSQNYSLPLILGLAVVGAFSKTLGSGLIYYFADKAEDILVNKFGKFFGISHGDTEDLGKFFGKGKRDDVAIFLMRAIPVMPTAPVSIMAGLIKINFKTYLVSTFLGLIVRNSIYLYLGYTSIGALDSLNSGFESIEKIGYIIIAAFAGVGLLWMYRKRQQGSALDMVGGLLTQLKKLLNIK